MNLEVKQAQISLFEEVLRRLNILLHLYVNFSAKMRLTTGNQAADELKMHPNLKNYYDKALAVCR